MKPSDWKRPSASDGKQYVYLVAKSSSPQLTFMKEAVILVQKHSGYVFLQTDKPVYTPNQNGMIQQIFLFHT